MRTRTSDGRRIGRPNIDPQSTAPRQSTIEAFGEWMRSQTIDSAKWRSPSHLDHLRYRIVKSDDRLQKGLRLRFSDVLEPALRSGYARDLGDNPDSARPTILAGATVAAFHRYRSIVADGIAAGTMSRDEQAKMFDMFIAAISGALDALR